MAEEVVRTRPWSSMRLLEFERIVGVEAVLDWQVTAEVRVK